MTVLIWMLNDFSFIWLRPAKLPFKIPRSFKNPLKLCFGVDLFEGERLCVFSMTCAACIYAWVYICVFVYGWVGGVHGIMFHCDFATACAHKHFFCSSRSYLERTLVKSDLSTSPKAPKRQTHHENNHRDQFSHFHTALPQGFLRSSVALHTVAVYPYSINLSSQWVHSIVLRCFQTFKAPQNKKQNLESCRRLIHFGQFPLLCYYNLWVIEHSQQTQWS